jgi:hypothetical protein
LYEAYPEFPQLNLSKETRNDIRGQFNPNLDLVTTGGAETLFTKPDEAKSTLLHELQHAIQAKEGFGRGGNPDIAQALIQSEWSKELNPYYEANAKFNGAINLLKQASGAQYIHKLDQLSVADNIKPSQIFNIMDWYKYGNDIRSELGKMPTRAGFQRDEWLRRAAQMMRRNVVNDSPHLEEYASGMNPNQAKNAYQRASRALDKVRPQAQKFNEINSKYKNLSGMDPTEQYKRLSGEAEARATQARMNMTPEERQATFPLESYDVPINELVKNNYKKGGSIHMSDNPDTQWAETTFKDKKFADGGRVTPQEWIKSLANQPTEPFDPIGNLKSSVQNALSTVGSIPSNIQRLVSNPKEYIKNLPTPTMEQMVGAFSPSHIGGVGMAGVIKPKGGNWLTGSVEKGLSGLKHPNAPQVSDLEWLQNHRAERLAKGENVDAVDEAIRSTHKNSALENWIDKNLTNYVKKEMATPEDPVRKLAEQGITHMPKNEIDFANVFMPEQLAVKRMQAGFSPSDVGTSNLAKGWERISDELINVGTAGQHTKPLTPTEIRQGYKSTVDDNPWLTKLDPSTPIYYPENMDSMSRDLGFDHIIDVLKEDVANGRLRPESLKNVSMEQAVRRTHEYDQELAKKMEDARAKKLEDMTVHKEYPEGYKWVQLDKPGQFASESQAMGHSVRGYEPPQGHPEWIPESGDSGSLNYGHGGWEAIKSGKAKVYSLVDPKGNPHTTVEVASGKHPIGYNFKGGPNEFPEKFDYNLNFYEDYPRPTQEQNQSILNRAKELYSKNPGKLLGGRLERMDAFQQAADEVLGPLPAQITQIKGKSNTKPTEPYLPYIQDFVKSGNWSDVGDLHNTDLTKIYPESDLAKSLAQKGMSVPTYATSEDLTNLLKQAEVGSYRDASRGTTYINDEHPDYRNDVPPETPQLKRGGLVHMANGGSNDIPDIPYNDEPMFRVDPRAFMQRVGDNTFADTSVNIPMKNVEIGAGYGDMCSVVHDMGFKGKYTIVDIPETQPIQNFYLNKQGITPEFSFEDDNVGPADLVISTWALSETPVEYREQLMPKIKDSKNWLILAQSNIFGFSVNEDYFANFFKDKNMTQIPLVSDGLIKWDGSNNYYIVKE